MGKMALGVFEDGKCEKNMGLIFWDKSNVANSDQILLKPNPKPQTPNPDCGFAAMEKVVNYFLKTCFVPVTPG
jgi:hypothetical protein